VIISFKPNQSKPIRMLEIKVMRVRKGRELRGGGGCKNCVSHL